MNPRDIWYVLFGLFTISAFPIGILSTHSCVHLSVWLIVHSIICATYYAFMLYFYSTFSNEHHILQEEYASLHQAKEQVLGQLGCEADEYGNDTLLSPGPKDIAKTKSLKLRSQEWGCLFFIAAYVTSLLLGVILYIQDKGCIPWVSYYGLSLIVTSLVGILGNSCFQVFVHRAD